MPGTPLDMTTPTPQKAQALGFGTTLRAILHAALLTGLVIGLIDFVTIAFDANVKLGFFELVWSGIQGIAVYVLLFAAVGAVLSPVIHLGFRHTPLGVRARHAFAMVLGVGLFMELYWWTRPYVMYGHPAMSPGRLFAAFVTAVGAYALGMVFARAFAKRGTLFKGATEGAAWAAFVIGSGGLLFGNAAPEERGVLNERNQDLPNVLLVVVDALRADVIGAYGNERVQTPVMDRLAENGVVFDKAFAQAPYTWTSFGSILTGKYPRRHGLMQMEAGVSMNKNTTLAWHLKEAAGIDGGRSLQPDDFASGTFMTGTLSHGSGLMQGFDVYFEALVGHELVDLSVPWSIYRSELVGFKFKNKINQIFSPALVVNTARDWLRENRGRRFTAMVHLYSTHTPYDPEPEFRELYVDPEYDGPLTAFTADHRKAIERGEYAATEADVQQIRDLYYGGVTQADHAIGLVLDELAQAGELDNTIVVITSDHGESLGDDVLYGLPLWEHNWMFESNLRVPLIMTWPNGLAKGVVVNEIVETVDIVPTICDLMGLELPDASARVELTNDEELTDEQKRVFVDGHSLVPLVEAAAGRDPGVRPGDRWDGFAFAENGPYLSIRDRRWKLVAPRDGLSPTDFEASLAIPDAVGSQPTMEEMVALSSRPRLFDLSSDPLERSDLIGSTDPEITRERDRLYGALVEWSNSMPVPAMSVGSSHRDVETASNMGDLGYTGNEHDEDPSDRLGGAAVNATETDEASEGKVDAATEGPDDKGGADDSSSGATSNDDVPSEADASAPE